MKSLSFKIVAWFAALLLASFLACIAVTDVVATKDKRWQQFMSALMRVQADAAERAYATGGKPALTTYLANLDEDFRGKHYLGDASGKDVLTGLQHSSPPLQTPPPPLFFGQPRPPLMQGRSSDGRYSLFVKSLDSPFQGPNVFPYYFAIIVLVLLICYGLGANVVRALIKLRQTVSRFGSGDLAARTTSTRRDELGDVSRAFDAMADRLQTLLTAERRLLQDISHELNSPLARLTLAVELARTATDRNAALDTAKKQAVRLSEMVDELLQMARVEGDQDARSLEDVCVSDLLIQLAGDYALDADVKHCQIQCTVTPGLKVEGDPVLIRRGLDNVIRNAFRHAPEGTPIEIGGRSADKAAEITVRDFGPGVPPEHLQDIFRPFFRVENDRARSSGGVGLGLAIVQRVVHMHHGVVTAENASPGLRITVRLPFALSNSHP